MGQQARERGGKKNWTIDGTGELFASIFYNAAVRFPTFPFYFLLSVVCEKKMQSFKSEAGRTSCWGEGQYSIYWPR